MKKFIIVFFLILVLIVISADLVFSRDSMNKTNVEDNNGYMDVFVRDNYAYCSSRDSVTGYSGLDILDISSPTDPIRIARFDTADYATVSEVFINSKYAYLANSQNGVKIIDISNPASPALVGAYDPSQDELEGVQDVYVSGNYAYLADWYHGFHIINISNPASPVFSGLYDTPGQALEVEVKGNYAYLADGYGGLQIINIANPSSPLPEGVYSNSYLSFLVTVSVRDNYAYALSSNLVENNLEIINISQPSAPVLTGSCMMPPYARDLFIKGNYAYVTCAEWGLQIVNVSNLSSPFIEGSYDINGEIRGVFVKNNYAYIADYSDGLIILDVSTPSNPLFVGRYNPTVQPRISLSRTRLNFGAVMSGEITEPQEFLINNSGQGYLHWVITDDVSWLNYSSQSGTNSAIITVTADPTGLPAGSHQAVISVSDGNAANSPQTIEVTLNIYYPYNSDVPFGVFSTPEDGSTVRSSIPVTGWALDNIGVESVKIYRKDGENLVYIGDAVFVEGARPDVEFAYPGYPRNYNAGWGYMLLTNFVFLNQGDGTFTLQAIALDKEGNEAVLGSKTITIDNANADQPFGALDTPEQGGIASGGDFVNWGWVLTPQPNKIPEDGSTISVYVDGVKLGNPTYNIYRSDVAILFPGYNNSNGAAGYFHLDTNGYEDGVHTIQWTATDNGSNTDGIGSRYFTVQNAINREQANNSSHRQETSGNRGNVLPASLSNITECDYEPIRLKIGYDEKIDPQMIYPDDRGYINIEMRELDRVRINLGHPNCRGFQVFADELRGLPIGSFLDIDRGIFYWHPGVGFCGEYEFVFFYSDSNGMVNHRKNMSVKITSKFSR